MIRSKTAALLFSLSLAACGGSEEEARAASEAEVAVQAQQGPAAAACWGQATKVFAHTGEMGEHAATQETPRLGLRNLARALFEAGVLPDDSMESLGAFVAAELGLSIDACM